MTGFRHLIVLIRLLIKDRQQLVLARRGEHGGIAIVERSMKPECARRIIVPFGMTKMRAVDFDGESVLRYGRGRHVLGSACGVLGTYTEILPQAPPKIVTQISGRPRTLARESAMNEEWPSGSSHYRDHRLARRIRAALCWRPKRPRAIQKCAGTRDGRRPRHRSR